MRHELCNSLDAIGALHNSNVLTEAILNRLAALPSNPPSQAVQPFSPLKNPLNENAVAEVSEAIRLLSAAQRHLEGAYEAMARCGVPVSSEAFKPLGGLLDAPYAHLTRILLSHYDAEQRRQS